MNPRLLLAEAGAGVGVLVKVWPWAALGVAMPLVIMGVIGWAGALEMPQAAVAAQSSKIFATDGQVVATLHGEQNRTSVALNKISTHLTEAVIATEDHGFYDHHGVSIRGIIRAAKANFDGQQVLQGGSTITQQYVRNAYPSVGTERTITRKVRESILAVWVDRRSSKEEILELYMNRVYFGRGAYGAEAAARTYFKVSAADLTVGQAAYLAGVIRSPGRYDIGAAPQEASGLRDQVIDDMVRARYITRDQAAAAKAEDLLAQFKPGVSIEVESPRAGYFVEYVRQILRREFKLTDEQILSGGLQIHTTLDLRMQDAAEQAVRTTLDQPTDPEAALVAMDGQGNIKAMVGGREVDNIARSRGYNFAVDSNYTGGGRPAGSAFKVIALASLVDQGKSIASTFSGPSTLELESPQCRNADGTPWEVSNFANARFGSLDVTSATVSSVNTVYAQIMDQVVSPSQFMGMAERLGIHVPQFDAGCALTLGTSDVTPLEMAGAYTTFAQRGLRPEPMVVTRITDSFGKTIAQREHRSEQALDPNVADTVNYVLERNIQGGTGTGARIGRPAAGKTGTTQNHENAWFAGYTPELTAVVWMGYAPGPDGTIPLMQKVRGRSVTGGSFPATIWRKFMSQAVEGSDETRFTRPEFGGEVVRSAPAAGDFAVDRSEGRGRSEGTGEQAAPRPSAPSRPSPRNEPEPSQMCGVLRNRECGVVVADAPKAKESKRSSSDLPSAEEIQEEVRRSIGQGGSL